MPGRTAAIPNSNHDDHSVANLKLGLADGAAGETEREPGNKEIVVPFTSIASSVYCNLLHSALKTWIDPPSLGHQRVLI